MVQITCLWDLCSFPDFLCNPENTWRMLWASQHTTCTVDAQMLLAVEHMCCDWPYTPAGKLGIRKLPIQQTHQKQNPTSAKVSQVYQRQTWQKPAAPSWPDVVVKTEGGTCLQTSATLAKSCWEGQEDFRLQTWTSCVSRNLIENILIYDLNYPLTEIPHLRYHEIKQ